MLRESWTMGRMSNLWSVTCRYLYQSWLAKQAWNEIYKCNDDPAQMSRCFSSLHVTLQLLQGTTAYHTSTNTYVPWRFSAFVPLRRA